MREILFKAQRLDNREWVEGNYCYINNYRTKNGEPKKHLICNGTNIFNDEIDPETLCQYIGRKDVHKKKIFEGDILLVGKEKWEVMYDSDNCMYVLLNDGIVCDFPSICLSYFEVIGNIHDKEE